MVWSVHGSTVRAYCRKILKRDTIAQYEMPPKMDAVIKKFQDDYITFPEMREVTSLRFTGMEGDQLQARQALLETEKKNYLANAHAPKAVPLPKAMPGSMTTSVRSPNIPSTTITPKSMPPSASTSQPSGRQGYGDMRNSPGFGAPEAKAARHDNAQWQDRPAYSWGASSWKGSGKGQSESSSSSWQSPWSAWQARSRERSQTWSWNPTGGQ